MAAITTRTHTYAAADGQRPALLAVPDTPADQRAGILFIHENKGLTPYMQWTIERLAETGRVVLAPDLMSRRSPYGEPPSTTRDIPISQHVADIRSALDSLEAELGVGRVAMVGFCFGGEAAFDAAMGRNELAALVSWYGVPPDSALELPDPMLVLLAQHDDRVNSHTRRFVLELERAGKDYTIQSYPDTLHAFHDWSRPERHAPAPAVAAWQECRRFLDRHLF